MTTDPQKKPGTRADDITTPKGDQIGISLYDIDEAIFRYMEDVVVPELEDGEKTLKVPVVYANAERWTTIQRQGFLRDERAQIQLPLIAFKRTSVSRDATRQLFSRNVTYPTLKRWSKRNRYDKFSLMTGVEPEYEAFNITMPEYVDLTYDIVMWTHYTEQMNRLIEAFRFASDNYWGDRDRFKFLAAIESFDTQQEVAENTERIIRTDFTVDIKGYILPSKFNNRPTTKKDYTVKRVVVTEEIDQTVQSRGRRLNGAKEDETVLDFLALKNTKNLVFNNTNIFYLTDVSLPTVPNQLQNDYPSINDRFRVYINGVEFPALSWTATYDSSNDRVIFTFIEAELGFSVDGTDEVVVIGKYEKV